MCAMLASRAAICVKKLCVWLPPHSCCSRPPAPPAPAPCWQVMACSAWGWVGVGGCVCVCGGGGGGTEESTRAALHARRSARQGSARHTACLPSSHFAAPFFALSPPPLPIPTTPPPCHPHPAGGLQEGGDPPQRLPVCGPPARRPHLCPAKVALAGKPPGCALAGGRSAPEAAGLVACRQRGPAVEPEAGPQVACRQAPPAAVWWGGRAGRNGGALQSISDVHTFTHQRSVVCVSPFLWHAVQAIGWRWR